MTADHDFLRLYRLGVELQKGQDKVFRLRENARKPPSPSFERTGTNGNRESKIENFIAAADEQERKNIDLKTEYLFEWLRLERYADTIEDALTRIIFKARYIDGKTWVQVARLLHGELTADACKRRIERLLKERSEKE